MLQSHIVYGGLKYYVYCNSEVVDSICMIPCGRPSGNMQYHAGYTYMCT